MSCHLERGRMVGGWLWCAGLVQSYDNFKPISFLQNAIKNNISTLDPFKEMQKHYFLESTIFL